jgi:hypothetical protein
MANNWLNTNWVSMQILRLLINKLIVLEYFNRSWEKDFNKDFAPGATVQVKFPQQFTTTDGMGYAPQGINRLSTTIALDQWVQSSFEWDDYEVAVKRERSKTELQENYFEPAAEAIAQDWDSRGAKFAYQNASTVVGALATDPTSVATYYSARQRMKEAPCSPGKKCMLISSSMMATLGGNITTIFNPPDELTKMWKDGAIGKLAGYDFFESNSLYSHAAGTWAGGVTVNGANQSGTSLTITATAADTFFQGDKFSIASVKAVNRMTRRVAGKGYNRQFTITQDLTAAGGGVDVINFLPAIYGPGSQYQNVDSLPANAAALTLWPGTTSPNGKIGTVGLALAKNAFGFVGGKLYVPKSVEEAGGAYDDRTGLNVRKVHAWDPVRSMNIHRMDSLGGFGVLYQADDAVAVAGA